MANAAVRPSPWGREATAWQITNRSARPSPHQGIPQTKRAPKRDLVRPSRCGEVQGSGFQGWPVVTVCSERLDQHTRMPGGDLALDNKVLDLWREVEKADHVVEVGQALAQHLGQI